MYGMTDLLHGRREIRGGVRKKDDGGGAINLGMATGAGPMYGVHSRVGRSISSGTLPGSARDREVPPVGYNYTTNGHKSIYGLLT